ncbi:MAG TPA: thiamine-phosphate kinase [Gammaproteobacteria bacterium]|nr:thiamine-phosphate kinase [Gammaproteobacteria bacterium]
MRTERQPPTERDIIEGFRARPGALRADVVLGIGDDGAVLSLPPDSRLVAVVDTLVEGVHFPAAMPARCIGHRALAVNLSDIAAMGATPAWATLALTLPAADPAWLGEFVEGVAALAVRHDVALVGGDTTRGPLTVTMQLLGFASPGAWLTRANAAAGDLVFVSGTLGDAAAGLALLEAGDPRAGDPLVDRFLRPQPRVDEGRALVGIASAAIDVSDGFAADLGKLLEASGAGAVLEPDRLPLSEALRRCHDRPDALRLALSGGDDYELCFTVPPERVRELTRIAAAWPCACTHVGHVTRRTGLRDAADRAIDIYGGYDHFRH